MADDLEHYPRWQPHLHSLGECEVKHGHKVWLVNFYDGEIGNRTIPRKLRQAKTHRAKKILGLAVAVTILVLITVGALYYRPHLTKPLTDKDRIVLADFTNTTADPVLMARYGKDSPRSLSKHHFSAWSLTRSLPRP